MLTHIRVLAVLHLVFGALLLLGAVAGLLFFGGIAGIAGVAGDSDAAIAVPILGAVGVGLFVFLLILAVPGLLAGWGLWNLRPWARVLTIVLSVLELFNFPFGTALGVYGLWALLSKDGERLFQPGASVVTL